MSTLLEPPLILNDASEGALTPPASAEQAGGKRPRWRGRADDPTWARPALYALLLITAFAYLWDLGASGWGNSFYAAAVQAGTHSFKAAFFGSFDASSFITVDKPPASLWVMEISARIFGLSSWSLLAPQALEGVGAVALLYATVRRATTAGPALLGAAIMAFTPISALIFRFNNPDALLVLLLVGAAYATTRAIEVASTRWLILAGTLLGFGFLTKMLQAFVIIPGLALAYLIAAPNPLRRRIVQVVILGLTTLVASGWWVAIVELVPASMRPYVGGSQNNSVLNLIFGYNGLGRITGQETGSITGGNVALGSQWGPTGLFRMFNAEFGGQASWLIPLALLSLVGVLFATRRAKRTDLLRASAVIWGGWLVVTDLLFSLSKGIIHQYYTVALAPGIGALVGLGAYVAYERRDKLAARIMAAIGIAGSAVWAAVLLGRTPTWQTWIKPTVLVAGLVSAVAIIAWPKLNRSLRSLTMAGALVAMLLSPVAYVVATSTTPHTGSLPTAGPVGASSSFGGGPGGAGGLAGALPPGAALRGRLGSQSLAGGIAIGGKAAGANAAGGRATGSAAGARSATGQFGPGGGIGGVPPTGAFPGVPPTGAARTGGAGSGLPSFGGAAGGRFGFPGAARGGAGGSLLDASAPSKALTALLNKDSSKFTWIVATVGSQSASGYQLATGSPVMAIGGFNGSDPAPSLATFIADVKAGKIHYFISSGGGGGGPSAGGTVSTEITTWVTKHFTAKTVDGVSVYDLTAPKGAL